MLDTINKLKDQTVKFEKQQITEEMIPDSFFMKSPLFKGNVKRRELTYIDHNGEIRISEKNIEKLYKKIKKYGYE